EKKTFLLGSALNEQGGGASLRLGHGGIPPTPPFRLALAFNGDFFGRFCLKIYNVVIDLDCTI
ncbi:hypothetical protein KKG18_03620, partial [Patescibacteria group bacterium]|nr:hypothetical protein [Patescibacteria group bacterium]